MKDLLQIMIVIGLIAIAGCQIQNETKFQCVNGEVVDSIDLCAYQTCPEIDCPECPKQAQTETMIYQCDDGSLEEKIEDCGMPKPIIKFQCQDGTIKDDVNNCGIVELSNDPNLDDTDVNYKFDNYLDYQQYVAGELEAETGVDDIGKYGSDDSARYDGSVYFLMSKRNDSWGDIYRYWAVQVNAETGELIKYKEITKYSCSGQIGSCPDTRNLWWNS